MHYLQSLHFLVFGHSIVGACPTAPTPELQAKGTAITDDVKWGVIILIGLCFFSSIGALIWGRMTHHPKGARLGFDGLVVTLFAAVLFSAGYAFFTGVSGCS